MHYCIIVLCEAGNTCLIFVLALSLVTPPYADQEVFCG